MRIGWGDLARQASGEVTLSGFTCPVTRDARQDYFVLAPEPMCCIGCLPRDPARSVEVFAAQPVGMTQSRVELRGRLVHLECDPAGFRFQLRDARVVAANAFTRRAALAAPLLCLAPAVRAESHSGLVTIDLHTHAGGVNGVQRVRTRAAFTPVAGPMREGGMAVICLAAVSDSPTQKVMPDRRIRPFRDPDPGELYAFTWQALERVHDLARAQGLQVIETAAQLRAARADRPGIIVSCEGADFLEGRIERVDEALARWKLRHLQLTHYRVNELGDIQTEARVHGGLTDFGAAVVGRCNALGIVVDVAHGTLELVRRAAAVTKKPLVLSHTSLSANPGPLSRTISAEHARLVAGTGGVIGIWPPASVFADLNALAAGMARMAAVVGVAHVGLGTDMGGLVGPSALPDYDRLPGLAEALLAHGFSRDEMAAMLGGNYARVFAQTVGG